MKEAGEAMVLQNNYFIEEIPNAILRKLSDEEMAEYRRPFAEPGEGRRPTLTWPRQIPIAGEPVDVTAIAAEYADWLGTSDAPKRAGRPCKPRDAERYFSVTSGRSKGSQRFASVIQATRWPGHGGKRLDVCGDSVAIAL